MNLFDAKRGTLDALQGVSSIITVIERSTLKSEEFKSEVLNTLKDLEMKLTTDNDDFNKLIEIQRAEVKANCTHDTVNHVIINDVDEYYECNKCGGVFKTIPAGSNVIKRIER